MRAIRAEGERGDRHGVRVLFRRGLEQRLAHEFGERMILGEATIVDRAFLDPSLDQGHLVWGQGVRLLRHAIVRVFLDQYSW